MHLEPYLAELNERQREAVLLTDGPVSVLAGAGSGKTKVLTTRIYHLIRQGVAPQNILAVTFTNKAAREMRERLATRLSGGSLPFVATFHGLGRELLESYGSAIGLPRYFSIFDRDDSERVVKQALKEMDIDPKEIAPRMILSRISKAKNDSMTAESFRERHGRDHFRSRITGEVWLKYEAALKKEKALDFDDLLVLPVRLLANHDDVRARVHERFSHIHIDEFQDTNEVQGKLAGLLSEQKRNLFVVGDIDQTIYTWRGATIDNLLAFDKTYPEAKTVVLEQNYRSSATIVGAANAIIEKNRNRKEKRSVTANPDGAPIRIHSAMSAEAEARYVAAEAKRRIAEGLSPEKIAILFRTNFQSRGLEEALLALGVPYKLLGTRFFDRKEVKDLIAWVRLSLDPSREADQARCVQAPPRGIGKVTLGKLIAGKRELLKPAELSKVATFEALVAELHQATKQLPPSEFVRLAIERSGMAEALSKGSEEDRERLENARELATLASRYDATPGEEGIAAFLADAALAGDQDELDRTDKKGVTLMTVHAAKGLEFDTVFVTGLEEGLFPHQGYDESEERDQEEERRLFYVAVTRAEKHLILSWARVRRIYGTDYLSEPSSFLSDLDPSMVEAESGFLDDGPTIYI